MSRAGFTLIEIMVVVGIIVVMLAGTMVSLTAGRDAARLREASRGVAQMTRYAHALALLRQRPVIVTYTVETDEKGEAALRIDVRLSGESMAAAAAADPADPIYREVDGQDTSNAGAAAAREEAAESSAADGEARLAGEKAGLFFTRRVLDPDELVREDRVRIFSGITATVEMLGEDGAAVDDKTARTIHDKAQGLLDNRASAISAWSSTHGHLAVAQDAASDDAAASEKTLAEEPVHVLFATNGNCTPHRVKLGAADAEHAADGFTLTISRAAQVTVGDGEDEE